MKIIIYGSKHGNAKRYANELGRRTGIEVVSFENVKDINDYEEIIYIGSLYAGGVTGLKKSFAKATNVSGKKITIASVGLANPDDEKNANHIKENIKTQVPKDVFDVAKICHLRGGIDYSKLSKVHKVMMAMLYKKVSKIPVEDRDAEVTGLIESYNKTIDFVDYKYLDRIEVE